MTTIITNITYIPIEVETEIESTPIVIETEATSGPAGPVGPIGPIGPIGPTGRGCYGNINLSDPDLVFPRIWYSRNISRIEFYSNEGTANITIYKNNVAIGPAFALSSGHTTVTNLTGYTITNTSGDYYSFHWNSGTATNCSIAMIMEG
jgi:hypothetical protein